MFSEFTLSHQRLTGRRCRIAGAFAVLLSALLLGAASGCSSISSGHAPDVTNASGQAVTLDLFSARGFLGGSDYERYYLSDGLLWRECGSVSRGKKGVAREARKKLPGDSVLKDDPQLSLQERRVERLSADQAAALSKEVQELLSEAEQGPSYPPPGSVFSLSDPGIFELLVRMGSSQQRVLTSVDAVADRSLPALASAHAVFEQLRGIGPEMCGARTFYGIARSSAHTSSSRAERSPEADTSGGNAP